VPKPFVQISIEWARDVSAPEIGRGFIKALCSETLLAPQQLGFADEFTDPYRDVEDFVANWWATDAEVGIEGGPMHAFKTGPYWRRRTKPASQGFVKHDMGKAGGRPTPLVWLRGKWDQRIAYERLFRE
jgi:hypothetical protein